MPSLLLLRVYAHVPFVVCVSFLQEWLKPDRPRCDDAGMHFQRVLERKMLPQVQFCLAG